MEFVFFVFLDDDKGKKSEEWGESGRVERWRYLGREEEGKLREKEVEVDERREEIKEYLFKNNIVFLDSILLYILNIIFIEIVYLK